MTPEESAIHEKLDALIDADREARVRDKSLIEQVTSIVSAQTISNELVSRVSRDLEIVQGRVGRIERHVFLGAPPESIVVESDPYPAPAPMRRPSPSYTNEVTERAASTVGQSIRVAAQDIRAGSLIRNIVAGGVIGFGALVYLASLLFGHH